MNSTTPLLSEGYIASGTPHHGRSIKQGCVVYLAGEGHHGIRRRLLAWTLANGIDLHDAPLVVSDRGAKLTDDASLREVMDAIDAAATAYGKPVLIVVDTLHRNFGDGDENSATDMGVFVHHLDLLRARYGAAIVTVHHCGHGDSKRSRGSSAIRGSLDIEYSANNSDGFITLACTKFKDAPKPDPAGYEIVPVTLPWLDADGIEAILLLDGQILDGRNRFRACQEVGVQPAFRDYTGDSPAEFVMSMNIHRRHLDASQRAMVAAKFEPLLAEEAKARQRAVGGDKKSDDYKKSLGARLPQAIDEPKPKAKRKPKATERAAKQAAAAIGKAGGAGKRMPSSVRYGIGSLHRAIHEHGQDGAVHVDDWRPVFYSGHTADSPDAKKVAFQRVRKELIEGSAASAKDDMYTLLDGSKAVWTDAHGYIQTLNIAAQGGQKCA